MGPLAVPQSQHEPDGERLERAHSTEAAVTAQLKTSRKEDFLNCSRKWQEQRDRGT